MDGRGRLAQSLTWVGASGTGKAARRRAGGLRVGARAAAGLRRMAARPASIDWALAARVMRAGVAARPGHCRFLVAHRWRARLRRGRGRHVPAYRRGERRTRCGRQRGRLPHRYDLAVRPKAVSREEILATVGVTGTLRSCSSTSMPRAPAQDQSLDRRRRRAQALSGPAADQRSRSAQRSRSGRRTAASG